MTCILQHCGFYILISLSLQYCFYRHPCCNRLYHSTCFWRTWQVWTVPIPERSKCQTQVPSTWRDFAIRAHRIFTIFSQNAEKLAPCGSTLPNESFNNSVASKAPKARHYSGSESLDYRVKAAVCQKNLGHSYVEMVSLFYF